MNLQKYKSLFSNMIANCCFKLFFCQDDPSSNITVERIHSLEWMMTLKNYFY